MQDNVAGREYRISEVAKAPPIVIWFLII